jgi:hypothetical protein
VVDIVTLQVNNALVPATVHSRHMKV